MEANYDNATTDKPRGFAAEKLVDDLKAVLQRAEEKAAERAKAADKVIREHPYQTIGLAFAVGLLIGILARRK